MYGGPLQLEFFFKKRVVYSQVVISIKFTLFKEMAVKGACFLFPANFNTNITPINITLCILGKKNKIESALKAIRSC